MGVWLQERDRLVLSLLLERRYETLDFLHERCFDGLSRKRVLNRLGDLIRAGYLERESFPMYDAGGENRSVYWLTPMAEQLVVVGAALAHDLNGRRFGCPVARTSVPHQIAINRVGDWLGTRFVSETLAGFPETNDRTGRPHATYITSASEGPRDVVFVVVDLTSNVRWYMPERLRVFAAHRRARALVLITSDPVRSLELDSWMTAVGRGYVTRLYLYTIADVQSDRCPVRRHLPPRHDLDLQAQDDER